MDADARKKKGFGKLEISSLNKGALVRIDGKEVGTLPLERALRQHCAPLALASGSAP